MVAAKNFDIRIQIPGLIDLSSLKIVAPFIEPAPSILLDRTHDLSTKKFWATPSTCQPWCLKGKVFGMLQIA